MGGGRGVPHSARGIIDRRVFERLPAYRDQVGERARKSPGRATLTGREEPTLTALGIAPNPQMNRWRM
jgi:hypothetical protein